MHNLAHVESPEATHDLDENEPNLLLFYVGFAFLVVADFLVEVSVVSVFHDETQTRRGVVHECFFIADHIGFVDRCKDPDFVKRVFPFFIGEGGKLDLLQGVGLSVRDAFHFVDGRVGSVPKLFDNLKV